MGLTLKHIPTRRRMRIFLAIIAIAVLLVVVLKKNRNTDDMPLFFAQALGGDIPGGRTPPVDMTAVFFDTFKKVDVVALNDIFANYGFVLVSESNERKNYKYKCSAFMLCVCNIYIAIELNGDGIVKVFRSTYYACV